MPAGPQPVQIEFVARTGDIPAGLWDQCFPAPLEGRFWYETLERCGLEDQFSFCYAVLSRAGTAIGIAPCFRHDVPITLVAPRPVAAVLTALSRVFPRIGFQRTFFVGSPCSDEGSVGLVPGVALAEVAAELQAAVRVRAKAAGAPMVVFKDFRPADAAVLAAARGRAEFVSTLSYPGTVLALPAPDKQAYFAALTHNRRHNFLKKLRRSQEILPLKTDVLANPSEAELDEIFGLFQQTYARGKTKFERLDRRFFAEIRAHAPARFVVQRDAGTGAMVAFMLLFCFPGRVINKFIGLDYRQPGRASLYFRLFDAALDAAYASAATELQSGQTGYRAKRDLGHRLVPLHNVFHHENRLIHALFRTLGRRITLASLDDELAGFPPAHPEAGP